MFLQYLQLRQLSPEPGGGGLGMSLEELENDQVANPLVEKPAEPVTPTPIPENETDEEKEEREQREKEAQEETARLAEEAKKPKPADPKPPTDPAPPADPATGDEGEDTFWDDVDKLRGGDPLDIDYGDIDPMTPQGALIRENAVIDRAMEDFDNYIEENYPEAYAFLEHMMAGGKAEDFFKVAETMITLPTEAELENDEKLQEQMITRNLLAKGMSEKMITSVIKAAKADDELEEASKTALKEEQQRDADKVNKVKADAKTATESRNTAVTQMAGYVDKVVATGEVGNLIIPEKDRKGFGEAIKRSIRYDNGKFIAVTELTNETMEQFFKERFFSFKGGNLKDLVEKQARTENTKRLVRTIKPDNRAKGQSTDGTTSTTLEEVN